MHNMMISQDRLGTNVRKVDIWWRFRSCRCTEALRAGKRKISKRNCAERRTGRRCRVSSTIKPLHSTDWKRLLLCISHDQNLCVSNGDGGDDDDDDDDGGDDVDADGLNY